MNELRSDESDSSGEQPYYRPNWRLVWWAGWNILALAWLGLGLIVAALADFAFSHWLWRPHQLRGAVIITVGLTVLIADIVIRLRDREFQGWRRYASLVAGGSVGIVPAWTIAIGVIVLGVTAILQLTH